MSGKFKNHKIHLMFLLVMLMAALSSTLPPQIAQAVGPGGYTYTSDADFDLGTLVNVNHNAPNNNQLQLNPSPGALNFIWIAASARGTIVKVNTTNGAILGEFWSAPQNRPKNPSRTTVDANGNVWAGNRNEQGSIPGAAQAGSVVRIGLKENGQCQDRNGNGIIETSTGLGNVLPWTNAGGADTNGGVSTAADECIINYVRTPNAPQVRHVSVDAANNVWVGGYPFVPTTFHKLNGVTGAIMTSFSSASIGCGGYGGLVDANGILWSATISQNKLLRYDPVAGTGMCIGVNQSYGMARDTNGFIWNSMFGNNAIVKVTPAGAIVPGFPKGTGGAGSDRGVGVTFADNNVWVANSGGADVSRLDNAGNVLNVIPVGVTPTGISIDAAGKVWVTNLSSNNAMRINPATNLVDLTVGLGAGAGPYNYSDMTGSTLLSPPNNGSWTIVHDTSIAGAEWGTVSWNGSTPGDSSLTVKAASSADGITFGPEETSTNGGDLSVANGRYLRVSVSFKRATTGESPILFDLTIEPIVNNPPDCSAAGPSVASLWPPNHKLVSVNILGVTDPDGDPVTITISSIRQDEPVNGVADGDTSPDGFGVGTSTAQVRAERAGNPKVPGNGRVYHIGFKVSDGKGGACSGVVNVGVPHDQGKGVLPVDDGPLFDSTVP